MKADLGEKNGDARTLLGVGDSSVGSCLVAQTAKTRLRTHLGQASFKKRH
jgi:hypothetical protein